MPPPDSRGCCSPLHCPLCQGYGKSSSMMCSHLVSSVLLFLLQHSSTRWLYLIYILEGFLFFFLLRGSFGPVELSGVCVCCRPLGQDSVMAHWICADQGEWWEIHKSLLVMHYYYTQTRLRALVGSDTGCRHNLPVTSSVTHDLPSHSWYAAIFHRSR